MAERKSCLISVSIEPTLFKLTKESADNTSELLRALIIKHLIDKGTLDQPTLHAILI